MWRNLKRLKWLKILKGLCIHHRFSRSAENIAIVSESVAEDSSVSIPFRSQELGLTYGTLWRIFHLDLHLHPYKVQLRQQPATSSNTSSNKIFFNDEAHFTLAGYINTQNCRIWGSEIPQVIKETPLNPEKVTLWSVGVIGPYFFENDDGTTVTVNSEGYGHIKNTTWRRYHMPHNSS